MEGDLALPAHVIIPVSGNAPSGDVSGVRVGGAVELEVEAQERGSRVSGRGTRRNLIEEPLRLQKIETQELRGKEVNAYTTGNPFLGKIYLG